MNKYDDIINLPHYELKNHKRMSMESRAAQFAPFAALTGYSDVRNYIRLVAYYGYDYSGHNTMKYYMAAQELIWEKINGREVYWVQGNTVSSPKLDVETEKNEIINLVNNHTKRPSFDDNTIEVNLGESKTIADNNGVLSSYQIYHSDIEASINGNSLTVKANNTRGNNEVQLIKKNYTTKVNFLYYNGESQKMISSGVLDPVISSLTIKTTSGNVTINKLDRQTEEKVQEKINRIIKNIENAIIIHDVIESDYSLTIDITKKMIENNKTCIYIFCKPIDFFGKRHIEA